MASYSEKLKSPKWQRKRLEILQRDEFKCCYCNDTETELQIHHFKYSGEPWEAKNENLVTLCKYCHELQEVIKGYSVQVFSITKSKEGSWRLFIVKHKIKHGQTILSIFELSHEDEWNFCMHLNIKGAVLETIKRLSENG